MDQQRLYALVQTYFPNTLPLEDRLSLALIADWFDDTTVFRQHFPEILLHVVRQNFRADTVLVACLEHFVPYDDYVPEHSQGLSYFYQCSADQCKVLQHWFASVEKHNRLKYQELCSTVRFSLDFVLQGKQLAQKIEQTFNRLDFLVPSTVLQRWAEEEGGHRYLTQWLRGVDWQGLIRERALARKIEYDFFVFSLEALFYYLPSYLVLALTEENEDYMSHCLSFLQFLQWNMESTQLKMQPEFLNSECWNLMAEIILEFMGWANKHCHNIFYARTQKKKIEKMLIFYKSYIL